ncbi:MAG: hypothetical protein AAF936_00575 [Pseudomonadota bacterium]
MHFITRLLMTLPRNATFPVIAVLAGWYGGAKYGAPDYVMNSIDGLISQARDIAGGLLPGEATPAAEGADGGDEVGNGANEV